MFVFRKVYLELNFMILNKDFWFALNTQIFKFFEIFIEFRSTNSSQNRIYFGELKKSWNLMLKYSGAKVDAYFFQSNADYPESTCK